MTEHAIDCGTYEGYMCTCGWVRTHKVTDMRLSHVTLEDGVLTIHVLARAVPVAGIVVKVGVEPTANNSRESKEA